MNKLKIAASVAALGIMGAALAQNNNAFSSDVTLRAGGIFPLNGGMRAASNFWGGVGVDYRFPTQSFHIGNNSETYLSADWFFRGSNGTGGNVFPVAINQRFFTNVKGTNLEHYGRTYVSIGLGAAFIDINGSQTEFMGRGALGVEFGPHVIAEAVLTLSGTTRNNASANALGVYLGYRF